MQGSIKGQPKIPIKVFKDYRPDGPIFTLLSRINLIKKARELDSVDFANTMNRTLVSFRQLKLLLICC